MATIGTVAGDDVDTVIQNALAAFQAMDPAVLAAQQVLLHGAIHALRTLLQRGCSDENANRMLLDTELTLGMVQGIAKARGITLPQFDAPPTVMH